VDRLLQLDAAVARWLRVVAIIGFASLMIGAGIVTADGLLRAFANKPIRGLGEIIDVSTAIVIATCFPIGLSQRQNIRIELIKGATGPRVNRLLDLLADLALFIFVSVVAVELIAYTAEVIRLNERSVVLNIPGGPFWIAASAIMVLSIPAQAVALAITFLRWTAGKDAPPHGSVRTDGPV
jgi:TRAP-type C4-dicarboxylate transport system permease small subunit